jgi:hypothetical protein
LNRKPTALVVLDGGRVVSSVRIETTPAVGDDARRLLAAHPHERLVVTGYGRAMAEVAFDAPSVTEIRRSPAIVTDRRGPARRERVASSR